MTLKKFKLLISQLAFFGALYFVSMTIFKDIYLFEWTARNRYLYIWVLIAILTIFGKKYTALSLTVGNLIGIIAGQLSGDYIKNENIKKITETMEAHEVYRLHTHYGFYIWVLTLVIFLVIGVVVQRNSNKNR